MATTCAHATLIAAAEYLKSAMAHINTDVAELVIATADFTAAERQTAPSDPRLEEKRAAITSIRVRLEPRVEEYKALLGEMLSLGGMQLPDLQSSPAIFHAMLNLIGGAGASAGRQKAEEDLKRYFRRSTEEHDRAAEKFSRELAATALSR